MARTLALTLSLLALCACEQPTPRCSVARGDFAALYELVSGTGPCSQLHGEVLSVQAYVAPHSPSDLTPDYDQSSIAIQPSALSALLAQAGAEPANAEDAPFALGAIATKKPVDELCDVPTLSTARVRLPAQDAHADMCTVTPSAPARDVSYEFRNVRVHVTADAYGTRFSADLTYRDDGCVAEYKVRALYPAVPCGVEASDERDAGVADASSLDAAHALDATSELSPDAADAGDATCPEPEASPALLADDSQCNAAPDPAAGRPVGSGINPEFPVRCDAELLLCVLSAPSLE